MNKQLAQSCPRETVCLHVSVFCVFSVFYCKFNVEWDFLRSGTSTAESYIDLVVAKALLHLIEQAAVGQLTEGCQVVIGCRRHQLHLKRKQGES